jgi:hypothetical protein
VLVDLRPCEGSSLAIVGRVTLAMREAGAPEEHIRQFVGEVMTDGSIVDVCRRWITVA